MGRAPVERLEFGGEFLDGVRLDDVTHLELVEAVDANATFHAGPDLVDLVLETAERLNLSLVHKVLAAHDANLAIEDATVTDRTSGDTATLGQFEDLLHIGRTHDHFLEHWIEQAGHGDLHLVDQFVDDGVKFDLHPFALGDVGDAVVDAGMETENNALGCRREHDVGLGDRADGAVNDIQRNFLGFDFLERLDNGFHGTLSVRFDDDFKDLRRVFSQRSEEIFERDLGAGFDVELLGLHRARFRQFAGRAIRLHHAELQTSFRNAVQTQHLHGDGRTGFLEAFAFLVDEGANLAPILPADDDITNTQRAFTHKHRVGRATRIEPGFNDIALGPTNRIGLELHQVGLEQKNLEQMRNTSLRERGNFHESRVATPSVRHEALFLK